MALVLAASCLLLYVSIDLVVSLFLRNTHEPLTLRLLVSCFLYFTLAYEQQSLVEQSPIPSEVCFSALFQAEHLFDCLGNKSLPVFIYK